MFKSQSPESKVKLGQFNPSLGLNRGVGKFKEICWYLVKTVFFLSALPYPSRFKSLLLRMFNAKVGHGLIIKPRVNIHMPWKLEIGNDVWIGEEAFILNFEQITIGNNVCISQRAFICGGNHNYKDPSMPYRNIPIFLEDGCWVGASTFIGPGVTIGVDTVVSAGSVVTSSLQANAIFKGNPAVHVKDRW